MSKLSCLYSESGSTLKAENLFRLKRDNKLSQLYKMAQQLLSEFSTPESLS